MTETTIHFDRSRFELAIFDCDGVLVDSERITNRIFVDMLAELGLSVTLDDLFEHFLGRSMIQCLSMVRDRLGRPAPERFAEEFRQRIEAAFHAELTAVPGVEAALDVIDLPCCVASSGDHGKMRTTLGLTGLMPRFAGRIFSVTEVARPKPAPDIFLHAASRCGATPGACAVIEDSPAGVVAGVAAGMTVFGFAAMTPAWRLHEAGAHVVFAEMEKLPSLLVDALPAFPRKATSA